MYNLVRLDVYSTIKNEAAKYLINLHTNLMRRNNEYYRFSVPTPENKIKDKYVERTVNISLLEFLAECYTKIHDALLLLIAGSKDLW